MNVPADAILALNEEQAKMLIGVGVAEQQQKMADLDHQRAVMRLHRKVSDAMEAGVPVRVIAHKLGVTRSRVYQMRDAIRQVAEKEEAGE